VLTGIKVVDLGRYISCPYCCQLLADMGADVVKVERVVKGEDGRHFGPFVNDVSLYCPTFNRNKRGVTLDFRNDEGKTLLKELIAQADVLVENFRPGTMDAMGLGYDRVREINPSIVMASISGLGQTGPQSQRPLTDVSALALSGLMSLTGTEESGPMIVGTQVADHVAGMVCALGIVSALYDRVRTGKGQYIDTSMVECLVPMLQTILPDYAASGRMIGLHGNTDMLSCPSDCYKAQDGYVIMYAGSDALYTKLTDLIDEPGMRDSKFDSVASRNANKPEVESFVVSWAAKQTAEELESNLVSAGIPAAKVASVADVYDNSQLRARNAFVKIEVPGVGPVPFSVSPVRMSDHEDTEYRRAPGMGENNSEVYEEWLGLSAADVEGLEQRGVI